MKIQISSGMYVALVINMVYAKAIGVTQGILAREVGADMWIATILATMQGIVMIVIIARVLQKKPNMDFISYAQFLLGKWFGKLVALVILVFFLLTFGPVMVTFVYHLKDYFLPEAPTFLFVLVGLIVGAFGCYYGLEVMGRMAFVGVFSIFCLNILLLLGSFNEFDIQNLRPVLDSGISKTLWASRQHGTDWAMATFMACIILPTVKEPNKWGRSGYMGLLFGGLMVLMWPILEAGVLSAPVTAEYIIACMQMARSAHIGLFIHRYEMIMVAFFATSALIQVMMCLYCSAHAMSKIVGIKDYRKMILPVCILLGGFGYWLVLDHIRAMEFTEKYWPMMAMPFAFGLPFLLWLLGALLKKKGANNRRDPI
jgi:spore germination protein KB